MTPMEAAILAARELGGPIIAMTVVLVAVYVPIGFQGGLTGALFTEFAFTLVGAVTVSGIVALTLSPMMCSRLLKPHAAGQRGWEARLDRLHRPPLRAAARRLRAPPAWQPRHPAGHRSCSPPSCWAASISSTPAPRPSSRRRRTRASSSRNRIAAPDATLEQRQLYSQQVYKIFAPIPETEHVFQLDVPGQSIAGMVLQALGHARQDHQPAAAGPAAGAEPASPACAWWRSSRRRCPAASACRCSSSSAPPSRSSASTRSPSSSCRRRSRAACSSSWIATSRSTSRRST